MHDFDATFSRASKLGEEKDGLEKFLPNSFHSNDFHASRVVAIGCSFNTS